MKQHKMARKKRGKLSHTFKTKLRLSKKRSKVRIYDHIIVFVNSEIIFIRIGWHLITPDIFNYK